MRGRRVVGYRKMIAGRRYYFTGADPVRAQMRLMALLLGDVGSGPSSDVGTLHARHRLHIQAPDAETLATDWLASVSGSLAHIRSAGETSRWFASQRLTLDDSGAVDVRRLRSRVDSVTTWAGVTRARHLRYLRLLLTWAADQDRVKLPNGWQRALTPPPTRAVRVDVFTAVDVAKIIQHGTDDRLRLWVLLALNCGFTAADLCELRPGDVVREDGHVLVRRVRGKTGVLGCWRLWPLTAALLEQHMTSDGLRTADGRKLIDYTTRKKQDLVCRAFGRLQRQLELRLSFKALRKTGATMVAAEAGDDVASMYLAHAARSVAGRHYLAADTRRFARLHDALGLVGRRIGVVTATVTASVVQH